MTKYSYEFKKKVVQEYLDGKGGYAYIAKQNGIPAESLLRRWVGKSDLTEKILINIQKMKSPKYTTKTKITVIDEYIENYETEIFCK